MEELLEREGELGTLRGMVDEARLGRGGTVVVEGAAGSGKTALLRRLREETLAADRLSEAVAAAEAEAADAQRRDIATFEAQALTTLEQLSRGSDPLEGGRGLLVAQRSPSLRARAEAAFEHGLALRVAWQRTEARKHLTEARDLAARSGLTALAARAAEEPAVTGKTTPPAGTPTPPTIKVR